MNRIPLCVTLFSLLLGLSLESLSAKTKYTTPDALRAIGNGSVYSFCQDGEGAVWMNTNYGLCRFNGNTLDYVYDNVPYNNMCGNGARYIYVPAQSSILRFETGSQEPVALKGANIDYPRCCMLADGDSLLVASGNRIYSSSGRDTLVLWLSLPLDEEISALARGSDNSLLAATKSGAIFRSSSERDSLVKVYQTGDGLSALFTDSKGWLWAGLQNGGAVQLDSLCRESARFSHSRQGGSSKKLREARTFCEDIYGNIYVGTLNGLFVISPEGICSAETDYSPQGHSICSLFRDRDNNIWLGTFYNGVFLCETNNSPFMTAASVNDAIRLVNAMVEDKRGDIWIVTDHYGLWKMDGRNGSCSLIAQTIDRKLKSAWYDPSTDSIWIGEHMGALNSFDIRSGGWSSVSVHTPSGEQHPVSIYSICPHGKDLYLAASDGVYVFTPGKEKSITRKIPGYDGYVYSIRFDENGILWICGYELMYYTESEGLRFFDRDKTQQCRDIAFGEGGEMTLAILGKGFRTIRDGALISYDSATVGLSDQYAYLVDRIGEHYLLGGTRTGISIIDTRQGRCYNFGAQNGLGLSSAREGCILHKSDGTVWIGGTDGIVWLNPSSLHLPSHKGKPVFDHCNPPRKGDEIVLPRDMHSLSVEVTNFDYSGIVPVKMEYRLEGLDDGWKVFDSSMPLSFNNLKPGKYTLRVRQTESFSSTDAFSENSLKIRVKSVWYLSTLAVILYLLVLLVAGIWAAQVSYSRKMLSNELKIKEKEGRDRMRFFINISHELRTPLTMIIGQLELFFRTNGRKSPGAKNIESSYDQAQKMQHIVSDLLDFEKQNQGYTSIKVSETDLCGFLSDVRESFQQYALSRGISLSLKLPSYKVPAMMDLRQMQSLMTNLLINSFKFTPDSGSVTVSLSAHMSIDGSGTATVVVSDTGSGICEEALERIFDPFYQDPMGNSWERRNQGTGIGLALCKGIIELHHGTISASNNPSGGASFTFTLPLGDKWYAADSRVSVLGDDERPELPPMDIPLPKCTSSGVGTGSSDPLYAAPTAYTMLIVEDDKDMQSMLVAIFEQKYKILTADNGSDGLKIARDRQPDIIISDVMMPVMDGLTFCASLRKDFEICHIPIILLTAHTSVVSTINGMDKGADDFVTKPFNIEVLEARCANLLENRKLLRQKFEKDFTGVSELVRTGADTKFISSVISVIEDNLFTQDLSVNLLCEQLHMSRTLLDRKIQGIAGCTPREFIENIRLKQAARLLKDSEMNVSQIAYELGYSSPKYFAIRFRKMFGVSPSEYKK